MSHDRQPPYGRGHGQHSQAPRGQGSSGPRYVVSAPESGYQQHQQQHQQQPPQYYPQQGEYFDEDSANMDEIEQEMMQGGIYPQGGQQFYDEDAQNLAALDQEFSYGSGYGDYQQQGGQYYYPQAESHQPVTQSGALSSHAAEFWFPESRNCACCKGFKHGCPCIKGGVSACQDAGCVVAK